MTMRTLAVLAILVAWPACWGRLPGWVETHRHPGYPQGRYILGVGVSEKDPEDAAEQARLEVLRQIRVKVESEVEYRKEAFGLGGQEAVREQFAERTRQIVHGEVSGIRIAETAEEDGRYYALAVLDRLRLAGEIEAEISEKAREVERLLEEAKEFAEEGKVPEALGSLSQAYELSLETSARLALYRAVAPVPGKLGAVPPSRVLSEVRKVTSGIVMEKVSGDGQEAREGEELGPMVVRVTREGRPVEGIRVRFTYADGKRIDEMTTNPEGEAEVEPVALATGPGVGEVVSRIVIGGLPEGVRLKGLPEVRFSYKVLREGVPVALEVRGPEGEEVEGKLTRALGKLGYPLDDRSPIVLKGKVEVREVKEVQGFGGTRVLANVRLKVSVTVLPSGRVLSSAEFSGRGMGRDEESAIRAAVGKLRVDRAKLARALREAEPAFSEAAEELARIHLERARSALREGDYRSAVKELEKVPPEAEVYPEARGLLDEVRAKLASRPLPTVAVLRPDATGWRGHETAEALRDMLVTALVRTGKVEVVERERLNKVLEEQKLGATGLVDPETASRIGKLVGAEYVLLGRVVRRGMKVEVDLRLVSVATGKVVAASSAEGLEEGLRAVAEELARKLVKKM